MKRKLVELTASSDFENGVLVIIESSETYDLHAFVLPTVAQVKN